MMLSKDAIADVVEALRGTDFYRPAHELVFDAILDLYGRGEPADAITVADELTKRGELGRVGGAAYLHTLISSVPTAANAGYYAQIVRERAVLRRLVEAGTRIVQLGYGARAAATSTTSSTRAGRGLRRHRAARPARTTSGSARSSRPRSTRSRRPGRARRDDRRAHGLLRSRPADQRSAPRSDDRHRRPARPWARLSRSTPRCPLRRAGRRWARSRSATCCSAPTGSPTRVVAATEVMIGRPCFEVEFSDGSVIVADAQHQWVTARGPTRRDPAAQGRRAHDGRDRDHAADRDGRGAAPNHSVANARALQLPSGHLPGALRARRVAGRRAPPTARRSRRGSARSSCASRREGLARSARAARMRYSPRSFRSDEVPSARVRRVRCRVHATAPRRSQTCGRSAGWPGLARRARRARLAAVGATVSSTARSLRGASECWVTSTSRGATSGPARRSAATCSPACSTPTAPSPTAGCVQFTMTNRGSLTAYASSSSASATGAAVREDGAAVGPPTRPTAYTLTFTTDDDVFWLERKRPLHKERRRRSRPHAARASSCDVAPHPSGAGAVRRRSTTPTTSTSPASR